MYLPRCEILDYLDLHHNIRLISADVIHDVDLREIYDTLKGLEDTIADLNLSYAELEAEIAEEEC